MSVDHYTYRVTWSLEDGEHVGSCIEFPSLSWLAETPEEALAGIRQVVSEVVADLEASGEPVPVPLAEKRYSGEFRVRIPPELHRQLALTAAEQGGSIKRKRVASLILMFFRYVQNHYVYPTRMNPYQRYRGTLLQPPGMLRTPGRQG